MARMSLNWLCLQLSESEIGENLMISFVHLSSSLTVRFSYLSCASFGDPIDSTSSIFDLSLGHDADELS